MVSLCEIRASTRPLCHTCRSRRRPASPILSGVQTIRDLRRDISLSAVVAGVVATLVGYSGSLVIVLEATRASDATDAQVASWIWAISIGSGVGGLVLTVMTRVPIIVAWSTPGAALLISSIGGYTFAEAVGAFIVASLGAAIAGWTGWFGRLLDKIPTQILQALLAGVLLPFVISGAVQFEEAPILAGAVILTFFIGKRFFDRYAVLGALIVGIGLSVVMGEFGTIAADFALTIPVFTMPVFSLSAMLSVALPLFIVTMASQNAPGLALLRHEGYEVDERTLIGGISTLSTLLAPFGNHGICMAAITAAIATGPESHPDRDRRYIAGITGSLVYLVVGAFGGYLISVFQAIPEPAIITLAAVALLSSTLSAIRGAMSGPPLISIAALVTLATTMSGIVIFSAGSAFWGVVAGYGVHLLIGAGDRG